MKIWPKTVGFVVTIWLALASTSSVWAVGGSLTLKLIDEDSGEPVISRVEFFRGAAPKSDREKHMPVRQTVSAGLGLVVDESLVLELPDGPYRFRIIRGPEYRIINGTFELEKTSLDEKTVALPRMADLTEEGWLGGDCCVVPSSASLPLRMASEDLHVAAVLGKRPAKPIPHRDAADKIPHEPTWIRTDVTSRDGLIYYGLSEENASELAKGKSSLDTLVAVKADDPEDLIRVGIENPFAWELPVWLASGKVSGLFVMGDWLRLDRRVLSPRGGRKIEGFSLGDPTQVGRFGERIYRHALDAGLSVVPLAGGGDDSAGTPVGYNRLYVTMPDRISDVDQSIQPTSSDEWWQAAWRGCSFATNGPLLRTMLAGRLPGHVFQARAGEELRLTPEVNLAVRDPVEYLEVIHNNHVHYSARLDEFAKAGGKIPAIETRQSGWVILRVLTLHEGHYRAAVTAPWWIEFDGQKRVAGESVEFFQDWLSRYEARLKQLPPEELQAHVPYVRAARRFWSSKQQSVNDGE